MKIRIFYALVLCALLSSCVKEHNSKDLSILDAYLTQEEQAKLPQEVKLEIKSIIEENQDPVPFTEDNVHGFTDHTRSATDGVARVWFYNLGENPEHFLTRQLYDMSPWEEVPTDYYEFYTGNGYTMWYWEPVDFFGDKASGVETRVNIDGYDYFEYNFRPRLDDSYMIGHLGWTHHNWTVLGPNPIAQELYVCTNTQNKWLYIVDENQDLSGLDEDDYFRVFTSPQ